MDITARLSPVQRRALAAAAGEGIIRRSRTDRADEHHGMGTGERYIQATIDRLAALGYVKVGRRAPHYDLIVATYAGMAYLVWSAE